MSIFDKTYPNDNTLRSKALQTDLIELLDTNTGEYVRLFPGGGGGGGGEELPTYLKPNQINFRNKTVIDESGVEMKFGDANSHQTFMNYDGVKIYNAETEEMSEFSREKIGLGNESVLLNKKGLKIVDEGGMLELKSSKILLGSTNLVESDIKVVHNLKNINDSSSTTPKMVVYAEEDNKYGLKTIDKVEIPYYAKTDKVELTNNQLKTKVEVRNDEVKIYDTERPAVDWSSIKKDSLTVSGSTIRKEHVLTLQNLNALGDIGVSANNKMVVYNSNGRFYKTNVPEDLDMPYYIKPEEIDMLSGKIKFSSGPAYNNISSTKIELMNTRSTVLYRAEMYDVGVSFYAGPYNNADWFSFGSNGISIGKGNVSPTNPALMNFTKREFEMLDKLIKPPPLSKIDINHILSSDRYCAKFRLEVKDHDEEEVLMPINTDNPANPNIPNNHRWLLGPMLNVGESVIVSFRDVVKKEILGREQGLYQGWQLEKDATSNDNFRKMRFTAEILSSTYNFYKSPTIEVRNIFFYKDKNSPTDYTRNMMLFAPSYSSTVSVSQPRYFDIKLTRVV